MADLTSRATVELIINGKSAQKQIEELTKKLSDARKEKEAFEKAGNTNDVKRKEQEIFALERQIDKLTASSEAFKHTLRNLDKVSFNELQKTLRILRKEYGKMEQGTEEWNRQIAAIRRVRAQLDNMRSTLRATREDTKTFLQQLKDWQTAAVGLFGYLFGKMTGFISYSRQAAEEFAAMDQEMANVRKYTGMSEESVNKLNESFKQIDTRTAREELNKYAQEAGRLGKTTEAEVLGYVRAADKINVALDDLGEGATLTLSKLTGIFGDEKRLGTEKALLSVGSVINELSQNCSASAPYLAEFASRMGGVGAQAGMSVQQIMAFGAVLDANNMNVEAASTALQQLMVRLYQKPAEYAKVAGIDAQRFSKLVREDMNLAVLELLSTLQKAGKMDVLAPMFNDMGEKGSNSVKALSTLAGHIDEVRQQQEAANKAFQEATSIDQEFAVQNTTKAAALDKQKKELQELRVELGQKLLPVVNFANTSGIVAMKILNSVTSFLFANKGAIMALAAAYAAYLISVNAAIIKSKALLAYQKAGLAVAAAKRSAIMLLAAAKALLTGNITRAAVAMKLFNGTMAASPVGLLMAAIAGLITWMLSLRLKTDECSKSMKNAMDSANSYAESLQKEKQEIDKLFGALDACKKETDEYNKAKEAIIARYGTYLTGLINEKGEIINLAAAYDRLTWAAERSAKARSIANAKQNINDTYIKDIDNKLDAFYKNLIEIGVDQRKATELVTKAANFFGSDGDINSVEWKNLFNEVKSLPERPSSVSFWKTDPLSLLGQMRDNTRQRNLHIKNLDALENRKLKEVPTDILKESIEELEKQLKETPNEMVSISIPVGSIQNGQKLANLITGGKIITKQENKEIKLSNSSGISEFLKTSNNVNNGKLSSFKFHGFPMANAGVMDVTITRKQAENMMRELLFESNQRGLGNSTEPEVAEINNQGGSYHSSKEADKEAKKQAAEARKRAAEAKRAEAKARKEFKEELNNAKGDWEKGDATNIAEYTQGMKSWSEFLTEKHRLQVKFYDDQLKIFEKHNLQEDEDYKELLKKKEQLNAEWLSRKAAMQVEEAKNNQKAEEMTVRFEYDSPESPLFHNEEALQLQLFDIKVKYLEKMRDLYAKDSKEYHDYQLRLTEIEEEEKLRIQKKFAEAYTRYSKEYQAKSAKEQYDFQILLLDQLKEIGKLTQEQYDSAVRDLKRETAEKTLPESARKPVTERESDEQSRIKDLEELDAAFKAGILTETEYLKAKDRIEENYRKKAVERARNMSNEYSAMILNLYDTFKAFGEEGGGNIFRKIAVSAEAAFAVMGAAMSAYSDFAKAETDVIVAKVEKRYDAEAALAEGNVYKQKQAEKKKQKEIARIKSEASKKQFAMQIFQAIAQTATNALNAYGALVGIPVVGPALAAAAAAMATAAGMIQVATLRKQSQAADASGYMQGGFTPRGRKDEPVGVVHAGEWVAPQEIVNSPQTRPLINLLENARRHNRVTSIRHADVSAATMPALVSRQRGNRVVVQTVPAPERDDSELTDTIARLNQRLDEPFVTVNSVTGPDGIQRALDMHNRLIYNKSRSRK